MNYRELPDLSNTLIEIVDLVFQFRFINRYQFQKYFGHKDPSRINKWLKELVDKGFLLRKSIYQNKLLENNHPAIYCLGNNGIIWARWCKGEEEFRLDNGIDLKFLKKYYQDRKASESFVNHCLTLFDLYLQFKEVEKKNKNEDLEYFFETKSVIWIEQQIHHQRRGDFSEIKDFIPDIHLNKVLVTKSKLEEISWYIILFDPHVPRYAMRYIADKFIECHEENDGKNIPGLISNFPLLLFVFPTQQKANQIGKYIAKSLGRSFTTNMQIQTSTLQRVMKEGLFGKDRTWKTIEETY